MLKGNSHVHGRHPLHLCIYAYTQYVIFFMSTYESVIPFMLNLYRQPHFIIDTIPFSLTSPTTVLVSLLIHDTLSIVPNTSHLYSLI